MLGPFPYSGYAAIALPDIQMKYVEHDEALNLDANDKLGSNYNYALFYPLINFDRTGKPSNRWAIFIYDDPGKDDTDVINTIKSVAIKIFDLKIKQIQREGAKENILRQGIIEQIKITYATKQNINNEDIEFKDYLVSLKEQDNRVEVYEGLPSKDALTLIHNRNTRGFNIKKIFVKLNNHQKYKYVYESNEQKDLILTALLEDNCYEISVDENDLLHLYDPINVQSYLSSVINQFIANE